MWGFILRTAIVAVVAIGTTLYFAYKENENQAPYENHFPPERRRRRRASGSFRSSRHPEQREGGGSGDRLHAELQQLHPDQLREEITDRLNSGTYECSICLEDVSRDSQIWSCPQCYFIYHLSCIQGYFHTLREIGESFKCPVCRTAINTPVNYSCFCGRKRLSHAVMRNEENVGRTPHTCSGVCSKPKCHLRCHPGPCNSKTSI